jgi:hypothetical protein
MNLEFLDFLKKDRNRPLRFILTKEEELFLRKERAIKEWENYLESLKKKKK